MKGICMGNKSFIENKISKIQSEIIKSGPFRAGSLSKQYNVCGKAGCKCKDQKNPQKHGPYYQISYYLKKKHKTSFVPESAVKQIESEINNYKKVTALFDEWTTLNTELSNLRLKAENTT